MSRPAALAFACLAAFLVSLAVAPKKPGLPIALDGDEATYYLMAASLAADGDLDCDPADLARLYREFPFTGEVRLRLSSDDGWRTARFGPPIVYPLLAAPWTAVWGARGPIMLNALLFAVAIAAGWRHLARMNGEGAALLYAAGFFVFSTAFVYLFRMEPWVFVMAMVACSLSLGWRRPGSDPGHPARWAASGAALALAACHQPALALLALPLWVPWARRPRTAAAWLAGVLASLALASVLSLAWSGRPWPARGADAEVRRFTVESPLEVPWQNPAVAAESEPTTPGAVRGVGALLGDGGFFLWGRRTGVLPYFPLLIPLAVVLVISGRPSPRRWTLLAALAALAVTEVLRAPVAGALYDGQVGNPHVIGVYPAFLFLLSRLPAAATVASYALGALTLSTLLLTPFGAVVPDGSSHSHTRNAPFAWLPFEYPTLGRASGFREIALHGTGDGAVSMARLWAPADQTEILSGDLWLLGGESVELWLVSRVELTSAIFGLRNLAPGNRVALELGGERHDQSFDRVPAAGVDAQAAFTPERPTHVRRDEDGDIYIYRLRGETRLGEKPKWRLSSTGNNYLGAGLAFIGTQEFLERDLYAVEWLGCGAPRVVTVGGAFLAAARLRNESREAWPTRGPARVRLAYRWLDDAGGEVSPERPRSDLPGAVESGAEVTAWIDVRAPAAPGRYTLEIEPLFERVAWFSSRTADATCRLEVEVAAAVDD